MSETTTRRQSPSRSDWKAAARAAPTHGNARALALDHVTHNLCFICLSARRKKSPCCGQLMAYFPATNLLTAQNSRIPVLRGFAGDFRLPQRLLSIACRLACPASPQRSAWGKRCITQSSNAYILNTDASRYHPATGMSGPLCVDAWMKNASGYNRADIEAHLVVVCLFCAFERPARPILQSSACTCTGVDGLVKVALQHQLRQVE